MRFSLYCCGAAVVAALACDDPFALGPATRENGVDTLELFAVNGTPLTKPSAYLLATKSRYRLGVEFPPYNVDFLYRIDSTGAPELVPFAAIASTGQGSSGRSGYLPTERPFDSITVAEQTGYVTDKPFALEVGQVLYLRSGLPNGCFLGIPFYAKLEVLAFDPAERSARFKILVNNNCGYRGLEPGLPEK
jgi:hypothetical protein